MKWLKKKYHDTKLWIRLTGPMTIVLLTILALFTWVLYGYASKAVNNTLSDSVATTLIRAESYMDMRLKNLLERMLYLRLDSSVDETLANYLLSEEPADDAVTESEMTRTLSLYRASESLTSSLLLYTTKQNPKLKLRNARMSSSALQGATPTVIANQRARWCGNPFPLRTGRFHGNAQNY